MHAYFERVLPHLFGKPSEDGIGLESIEERVRVMLGTELGGAGVLVTGSITVVGEARTLLGK